MDRIHSDERTRLLGPSHTIVEKTSISHEVIRLATATAPITTSFILQNLVQAVSIAICGSLGPRELDIASYGFMFASCTSSMVSIGGATALDTLCGQIIASTKVRDLPTILGKHLQQTLFVLSLIFLGLITPIWVVSGRIFLALGQQYDFAMGTGRFLVLMLPAGFTQMVAECLKKYCQVQGWSNTVGSIVCVAAFMGIIANLVLVKMTSLGLYGATEAFFIYHFTTVVLLGFLVAKIERQRRTIRLLTLIELFDGLGTTIFLSLSGLFTVATEWWSFEIIAMMAANLKPAEISAQSILMSTDLILTTVSLGIGVASSHRIGELLGAGNTLGAKRAAIAPYLLSFCLGTVEFALIMVFRSRFGYLFTSDKEVVAVAAQVLPALAVFQILDISNGGSGGILRGTRRNHICGMCNVVAYYGIGLTLAWTLCFHLNWGLIGLWIGIITGSGTLFLLQSIAVLMIPWASAAKQASG